ncbi:helix-turn-helix domain-containing protein [Fuchsiella alkaliacetigena]|uniref:helix-turn-helix domain-containing protein n=1 Tax=Fuchsiella alkaliacetigena TaxID=957042 RepID=UPI00200AFDF9|nr:helix-turn-helix transcriptional regulator [Fuchsiella alkaliacetigena]MCK8824869.1 helix-turn-helix domain-containing protein [Fuchsiella alkaliacetigena]
MKNQIGTKISMIRKHKKISQSELAQNANLSQSFISHLELGKRSPTLSTLNKIAEGLNMPLKKFLLYIANNLNSKIQEGTENITMGKEKTNKLKLELQNIKQKTKKHKDMITRSNQLDKEIIKKYGKKQHKGSDLENE